MYQAVCILLAFLVSLEDWEQQKSFGESDVLLLRRMACYVLHLKWEEAMELRNGGSVEVPLRIIWKLEDIYILRNLQSELLAQLSFAQ